MGWVLWFDHLKVPIVGCKILSERNMKHLLGWSHCFSLHLNRMLNLYFGRLMVPYMEKYVMFAGWILVVINTFTDVLGTGSNVGFIVGSTDGEVLGYNIGVHYRFIVSIDEVGCMFSLVR